MATLAPASGSGRSCPTLLILSVLIFGLQQLMPGDPALILAGEERGDPEVLAQIRAELSLDRPLPEQYLHWIGRVLVRAISAFPGASASRSAQLILEKLPVTFQLASMAFLIAVLIGVPAGIISAVRATGRWTGWPMASRCSASRRRISGSAS